MKIEASFLNTGLFWLCCRQLISIYFSPWITINVPLSQGTHPSALHFWIFSRVLSLITCIYCITCIFFHCSQNTIFIIFILLSTLTKKSWGMYEGHQNNPHDHWILSHPLVKNSWIRYWTTSPSLFIYIADIKKIPCSNPLKKFSKLMFTNT